jgi:putative heme-binding domain-containing protein
LSDRDPSIQRAAIQWVGEHRLVEFRPQLQAGLAASAETRNLFEATLAALERLDGKMRDIRDEVAGEEYITALFEDPRTPAVVLARGLRMLRADHPALSLDRLRRFLNRPEDAIRIEAVRSLAQGPLPGRFPLLAKLAEDQTASASLRAEAILGLAYQAARQRDRLVALATEGEPVLRREALRSLRGIALTEHERSLLRRSSDGDAQSLELVALLGTRDAATTTRAGRDGFPNSDIEEWLARLEGPADAAAGERVFFHSQGPGCFRCHQVEGRGGRAGPDLSTLAAGLDRRRLVESILAPSKEIAPQFTTWSVARTDGTVFSGIMLDQSPEGTLVFGGPEGRLITIKAGEISERKSQANSIMPDNLTQSMTVQEFRDLLAFLLRNRSERSQEVTKGTEEIR